MEKIKYLFLILFLVGCTSNDKAAVDYYLINKPLYDYDVEEKIKKLNIDLPTPGEPIANYVPAVRFSETKNSMLVYVSGTGPRKENGDYLTGRLGDDMTIEEGYNAAKLTGINILASLKKEIGDLNKIKRFSAISLFETFASIEASGVSVIILFKTFQNIALLRSNFDQLLNLS